MAVIGFLHFRPGDGAAIGREISVSERFIAVADLPKIDWSLLEAIKGCRAALSNASLGFEVDLSEKLLGRWVPVAIAALGFCGILNFRLVCEYGGGGHVRDESKSKVSHCNLRFRLKFCLLRKT